MKQKYYKLHSMKILARHKWLVGCTITESVDREDTAYRRFTATINGWQNFKIYEGFLIKDMAQAIINRVKTVQERIQSGDDSVFNEDVSISSIS